MAFSPIISQLIEALRCLPGVGPKSAQRMALHLLTKNRNQAQHLAHTIDRAVETVQHCQQCNILSEQILCSICDNPQRNATLLCIVESPADVFAIEQTQTFNGHYFVLAGHLSPIDGMGPEQIGIPKLTHRLQQQPVQEIILATSTTIEGEATAQFITNLTQGYPIKVSRIAHGIPMGGELEYVDSNTLRYALTERKGIIDDVS